MVFHQDDLGVLRALYQISGRGGRHGVSAPDIHSQGQRRHLRLEVGSTNRSIQLRLRVHFRFYANRVNSRSVTSLIRSRLEVSILTTIRLITAPS